MFPFSLFALVLSLLAAPGGQQAAPPEAAPGVYGEPAEASKEADAAGKIDGKVLRLAEGGERELSVFVLLRSQPQREVLGEVENRYADRLKPAERRFYEVSSKSRENDPVVNEARENLEREMLAVREEAFRLIRSRIGSEQEAVSARIEKLGGRVLYRYAAINMLAAVVPVEALQTLAAVPAVARIVSGGQASGQLVVSTQSIGAPVFWDAGLGGAGESVAVLDTGLKLDHPAFANMPVVHRVFLNGGAASPCFNDQRTSANDLQGHGTHVAGIVASRGSGGWSSYTGVARSLGLLYNLKVAYRKSTSSNCANQGNFDASDVMAAFDWAIQNAPLVKVFNFSAGADAPGDDDDLARLFDFLADTYDLTIAVAGGNESRPGYTGPRNDSPALATPAIGYNVLAVASMNTQNTPERSDDEVSIFSSRGPTKGGRKKPDLAAPGGLRDDRMPTGLQAFRGIYSVAHDSADFVPMAGTSMAAPHVAGAAALLRQAGVRDAKAVKALLLNSADAEGWDAARGWGYVNLARAFVQKDFTMASSVPRGGIRLLRGSANGPFQATLAWNRTVNAARSAGCLSNLNLALYHSGSGSLLASSSSRIDNVEQVRALVASEVVLAVNHLEEGSCRDQEGFGLALSHGGFEWTAGPVLGVSCEFPSQAAPSSQATVACTVQNTGDVPALSVSGGLAAWGSLLPLVQPFGTVPPGSSVTRTWTLTVPESAGSHEFRFTAESVSFGLPISASARYNVVSAPSSTGCTISLSSTSAELPAAGGSVTVQITTGAGCSWSASNTLLWASFVGSTQGSGSGSVTLQVAANSTANPRTGTVTIGGRTFTLRQSGQGGGPQLRRVLPQMAFGSSPTLGNWTTELYLHNLTGSSALAAVSFYAEDGSPISVPKWGPATIINLGPRGTALVDLSSSGPLVQGSIHLDLPEGVTGYGVFRQASAGLNPQEGVIPFSSSTSAQSTVVFDETSYVTAIAIANPGASAVTVTASVRDGSGNSLGSFTLNLAPKQRSAFVLRDRPELQSLAGKRGAVEFRAPGGAVSVLGLRFNGLAFTSILPLEQ
jgi:serine protease AprX